jgi:two-component system chemotaxis response regulator CheB
MPNRDVLAIGTSAGGFDALRFLARSFPADFPAAVLITLHLLDGFRSEFDRILSRDGRLPAVFAKSGMRPEKGRIYIAPAGVHLLADGALQLGTGPQENFARPAIDAMLRSVAVCCGVRAVGVVLTGKLHDGAEGLWAIKQCGGIAVVQDPQDAAFPEMPTAALRRVAADYVVKLTEMPMLLATLAAESAGEPVAVPASIKSQVEIARGVD